MDQAQNLRNIIKMNKLEFGEYVYPEDVYFNFKILIKAKWTAVLALTKIQIEIKVKKTWKIKRNNILYKFIGI